MTWRAAVPRSRGTTKGPTTSFKAKRIFVKFSDSSSISLVPPDCLLMRRPFVLLLFGFVASLSQAENKGTPGKLPKDIFPESYLIHLEPNVEQRITDGTESISIRVQNPTNHIVLNALEINIVSARIAHGENQDELTPQYDAAQQTVLFDTKEILAPGSYTLTLKFTSKILETPHGLFVESCQTGGSSEQVIATRMEPADARRVFPCWDEPSFRATFQLSVRT